MNCGGVCPPQFLLCKGGISMWSKFLACFRLAFRPNWKTLLWIALGVFCACIAKGVILLNLSWVDRLQQSNKAWSLFAFSVIIILFILIYVLIHFAGRRSGDLRHIEGWAWFPVSELVAMFLISWLGIGNPLWEADYILPLILLLPPWPGWSEIKNKATD